MSKSEDNVSIKLWGEYDNYQEENKDRPLDVSIESLNHLIEQAMQPDVLRKLPLDDSPTKFELPIGDERVLHTIELQQYHSKIIDLQEKFEKQHISEIEFPPPPEPEPPRPIDKKYRRNCFNQIPKFRSDFVDGVPLNNVPEIDKKTCRLVLRRSILMLLAHIGYTGILSNTLDTFIDALDEYYKIITKNIHSKMDSALLGRPSQFCNIYDHIFHDMGIGNLTVLHDYYQNNVIEYEMRMYKKCIKARRKYIASQLELMKQNQNRRTEEKHNAEKMKNEDIIPVLHLPDDSDNAGYIIDTSLYNLIPDVEVFLDQNQSCLMNLEAPVERQTTIATEEPAASYFDVEDLGTFCQ